MIRVLLVDDTPDIRGLLRAALTVGSDDIEVVGEAEDGTVAIKLAVELRPDVVVLDWHMPVMDGLTALPLIKVASPGCRVLMYSSRGGPTAVEEARAAGADAYAEKTTSPFELAATIRALGGG